MADAMRSFGSITADTDIIVGGIVYAGKSTTTGTTRTWQAQGTETNITLQVVPKGTGTLRVPTGYEANVSSDRDVINRLWANTHLVGQTLSAALTAPSSGQDGYSIVWDNANTRFDLVPAGGNLVIEDVTGTTYNFVAGDNGKLKRFTHASGCTATVPTGLANGWQVLAYRAEGAGVTTFASAGTLEGVGTTLPAAETMASIIHRGSDIHVLTGALTTGSGSVTSVGLNPITGFISVSGSPIVGSGDFTMTLVTQTANTGFWGPASGAAASPSFRAQVLADLPNNAFEDVAGTTYTFLEADNHKIKRFTNASGCTATIPTGLTTGWEVLAYRASGAGALTFASLGTYEGVATTLTSQKTAASILHRGSDIHVAIGAFAEGVGTSNQILATNDAGTEREWKTLETSTTAVSNNVGVTLSTAGKIIINVPNASLTNRGVIDTGTQSIAGSKHFSHPLTVGNIGVDGVSFPVTQGIVRLYSTSVSTDIGLSTSTTHLYATLPWQMPRVTFTSSGNTADASAAYINAPSTGDLNFNATSFKLGGTAAATPTTMFFRGDGTWAVPSGAGGLPALGTANQILAVNNAGAALEYKTLSTSTTPVANDVGVTLTGANAIVINIPSASATDRGVITTGTQTIAGSKTLTSTLTVTGNVNGFAGIDVFNSNTGISAEGGIRLNNASSMFATLAMTSNNATVTGNKKANQLELEIQGIGGMHVWTTSTQSVVFSNSAVANTRLHIGATGVGIGNPNSSGALTPSAAFHLPAGTAAVGGAPLKMTSGTALTTPENGALEYHSSHLYFTIGSTRYQLDQQGGGGGGITNSAANTEVMVSDGTNAVGTKLFSASNGNLTLGDSSTAGDRRIGFDSSAGSGKLTIGKSGDSAAIQFQEGDSTVKLGSQVEFYSDVAFTTNKIGHVAVTTALGSNEGTIMPSDTITTITVASGNGSVGGTLNIRGGRASTASGTATTGNLLLSSGISPTASPGGTVNSGHILINVPDGISSGTAGNVAIFNSTYASAPNFQSGQKIMYIGNAVAAPSGNPTGGGFFFAEGGALKWRGSSGTVTVLGIA